MVQLRDGSEVEDSRLGRLIQFDERSRGYPIRALVGERKPRSYTWAVPSPALDQLADGACVGAAFGQELGARPVPIQGVTMRWAKERVYWEAQKIDPWDGGSWPGAQPFYEGTSVLAGAKVLTERGWYGGYRWGFGLSDLVLTLGYAGPAVLGIMWQQNMFRPTPEGQIRPGGGNAGGHAVLAYKVDVKRSLVGLWNSWGPRWGLGGACWMTWDDIGERLDDAGECLVPTLRKPQRLS
jgi:hypothetical protein